MATDLVLEEGKYINHKYSLQYLGDNISKYYLFTRSPQQRGKWSGDSYRFKTESDLIAGFKNWKKKLDTKEANRLAKVEERRAARATFDNPYNLGDILYSSWGYEQTNREFYQVLEVRPRSIKICEIAQCRNDDYGWMCGTCSGVKDNFIKDHKWITIQVYPGGSHYVPSPIHGSLYLWDGKPLSWSGYH